MKRILMIAYHFPPLRGSSGIQRTLKFARYLPEFGWEPVVLTVTRNAYPETAADQLADIPQGLYVCRALALDAARHFSISNRYPGMLARPDRWMSWWFGAVPSGLGLIRRFAPDMLWSTYPIATAHAIGATLQRMTRLPWIADFRDPMAQDGYPPDPRIWRAFKSIEERVVARARRLVFTTPGAERMYRTRYPELAPERCAVIENGYDEETFSPRDAVVDRRPLNAGMLTLLHSGIVYAEERDPAELMRALRRLRDQGALGTDQVRVRFRAAVNEALLRDLAAAHHVTDLVEILPAVDYRFALAEMERADALLILQAANCNEQIPAKLYEYFRARRPIVALTDPAGDTALTLQRAGYYAIAPLDNAEAIARLIVEFARTPGFAFTHLPDDEAVVRNSRRTRASELAALLDRVA